MPGKAIKKANVRFNYHDYLLLPGEERYEILDGDLFVVPAPGTKHQRLSTILSAFLLKQLCRLGTVLAAPCDVLLSHEDIAQPDILFVRKERCGIIGEQNIQGSPDLIVEILSRSTREKDLSAKRKVYSKFGVREYWIIDPEKETIEVLVWSEIGYISVGNYGRLAKLCSPLLSGVRIPLSNIFQK